MESSCDAVVNAKVAVNKDKTDAQDIQTAYYELKAALDYVEGYKLDPEAKNDISVKGAKATAFSEDNGTYGIQHRKSFLCTGW